MLPESFLKQITQQLDVNLSDFQNALSSPPPISIRLNSLKQINWPENSGTVKWNTNGLYLKKRPIFTLDPLFHAGTYYVQEASSMFLAQAIAQTSSLERPMKVLDLCAAPGGKSTLISSMLPPGSILLANEVINNRYQILQENLLKWGTDNWVTSNHDSKDFKNLKSYFDLVVVDAPCSGEGLFRKNPKAIQEWSPNHVQLCSGRQKRILADAAELVSPGGILIYSTCTYNDSENEDNVRWLMETFPFTKVNLTLQPDWGIVEKAMGYQFYPHLVQGEGFYLSCLRKKDAENRSSTPKKKKRNKPNRFVSLTKKQLPLISPWLENPTLFDFYTNDQGQVYAFPVVSTESILHLASLLPRLNPTLQIGTIKGRDFIPSPGLALSLNICKDIPFITLDKTNALLYLKRENFSLGEVIPQGWFLIQYEGHNLGWAKGLKRRVNNYYPKQWRIRMEV